MNTTIDFKKMESQVLAQFMRWRRYPEWNPVIPGDYLVTLKPWDWQEEAIVAIAWWDGKKFSKEYVKSDYSVVAFMPLPAPYLIELDPFEGEINDMASKRPRV